SREEFAVGSVLWNLVDTSLDVQLTKAIARGSVIPVIYADSVSIPLRSLWGAMSISVSNVADLHSVLAAQAEQATIDLDGDGTADVTSLDEIFLMHGFLPI